MTDFNQSRDVWLRFYRTVDVTVFGDDWPVWLVSRWERNGIGEERFTGEARVYKAAGEGVTGDTPPGPQADAIRLLAEASP